MLAKEEKMIPWTPIEDLPAGYEKLASNEIRSLSEIWAEQSVRLKDSDALKKFNEELSRRWAIETGVIENLYSIDRGTTEILIRQGIQASLIPHGGTNKPVSHVINLIQDQHYALDMVFDFVKQNRGLSTSYIKSLLQLLTRNQDSVEGIDSMGSRIQVQLLRGDWKKQQNNPTRPDGSVVEYCPPEHVSSEMDTLLEWHNAHIESEVPVEIEAAWLHHRFTQIHPFQDGNGRVARALASLVFLRAGWFPLIIDRDNRVRYLDALEAADEGNLNSLIELFCDRQKKSFLRALSIVEDLLSREQARKQILEAAKERFEARSEERLKELRSVFEISEDLEKATRQALEPLCSEIDGLVRTESGDFFATVESSGTQNDYYFKGQIVEIAKHFDYYADTGVYRSWVRLKIKERTQTDIVFSFHGLGFHFAGIMAVSAFVQHLDLGGESQAFRDRTTPLSEDVFQFSYRENPEEVKRRFQKWLDSALDAGLDDWRRQL